MNKIPWGPIRSTLTENFSFGDIKQIVGYANIDMSQLAHLEQKAQGGASKSQLLSIIDSQIGRMDTNSSGVVTSICCEEILRRKPNLINRLEQVLSRVGWKFSGTDILPIEIFDVSELKEIPKNAQEDIQKATRRLRDGDLSGSISASCGALDTVTSAIYQEFELGDHKKVSFKERIKESIKAIKAKENLQNELRDVGWKEDDINALSENLENSLNNAILVMQGLRSKMGDVHGTKRVVSILAYDSINWSLLLLRVLATRKGV